MSGEAYLAIDLGAESGRAIAGVLHGHGATVRVELHELHRFLHRPVAGHNGLHWDVGLLLREISAGMKVGAAWQKSSGRRIVSMGVDTWGVDYGLIGASGELLAPPRAYRDARHERGAELLDRRAGFDEIYAVTGIQRMAINTLPQLVGQSADESELLASANRLLMMPDLLHYLLSGRQTNESTIASTSQLLDARTGKWSKALVELSGLPARVFGEIIEPGTVIGAIRWGMAEETGLADDVRIVAPAAHDTACAVAAVPAENDTSWCYLSSGTWSLLGAELQRPCLSAVARDAGFTNERGMGDTIRFHKNLTGLWMIQECRREFRAAGLPHDYTGLSALAESAEPFRTRIDVSHGPFSSPGGMVEKIRAHAAAHHDPIPEAPGQIVRCCLEGLAMAYRRTLSALERVLGQRYETVHIVGGGAHNGLLNQMTADATGRRVVAGPFEATAAGNILIQAVGAGHVRDRHELRRIVRASGDRMEYAPNEAAAWDAAFGRYVEVCR